MSDPDIEPFTVGPRIPVRRIADSLLLIGFGIVLGMWAMKVFFL